MDTSSPTPALCSEKQTHYAPRSDSRRGTRYHTRMALWRSADTLFGHGINVRRSAFVSAREAGEEHPMESTPVTDCMEVLTAPEAVPGLLSRVASLIIVVHAWNNTLGDAGAFERCLHDLEQIEWGGTIPFSGLCAGDAETLFDIARRFKQARFLSERQYIYRFHMRRDGKVIVSGLDLDSEPLDLSVFHTTREKSA